jgi:hypothetical protein
MSSLQIVELEINSIATRKFLTPNVTSPIRAPHGRVATQRVTVMQHFSKPPPPNRHCKFPSHPALQEAERHTLKRYWRPYLTAFRSVGYLYSLIPSPDTGVFTSFRCPSKGHFACLVVIRSHLPVPRRHVDGFPARKLLLELRDHRSLDPVG